MSSKNITRLFRFPAGSEGPCTGASGVGRDSEGQIQVWVKWSGSGGFVEGGRGGLKRTRKPTNMDKETAKSTDVLNHREGKELQSQGISRIPLRLTSEKTSETDSDQQPAARHEGQNRGQANI